MSTLEERCQLFLDLERGWAELSAWTFCSLDAVEVKDLLSISKVRKMIHLEIEKAPEGECITSSSQYIRDFRRWYEENKSEAS